MEYHVVLTVAWSQLGQDHPETKMLTANVNPDGRSTGEIFDHLYNTLCIELRKNGTLPIEIDPAVVCFALHPDELRV